MTDSNSASLNHNIYGDICVPNALFVRASVQSVNRFPQSLPLAEGHQPLCPAETFPEALSLADALRRTFMLRFIHTPSYLPVFDVFN